MLNIEQRIQLCELLYVLEKTCRGYDTAVQTFPANLPPAAVALHRDLAGRTAAQTRAILDHDKQIRGRKHQLRYVPHGKHRDEVKAVADSEEERQRERERAHDAIRARKILHAGAKRRTGPKP